jgi:hypothetical protein
MKRRDSSGTAKPFSNGPRVSQFRPLGWPERFKNPIATSREMRQIPEHFK